MSADQPKHTTILVVDDDPANADSLALLLQVQGYGVSVARSGQEALQRLRAGPPPDLILLDLLMPGVDGWETAARLQDDPSTRDIPVVILSVMSRDEAGAVPGNVVGWLTKPVNDLSLLRALEQALAREAEVPPTLPVGVREGDDVS